VASNEGYVNCTADRSDLAEQLPHEIAFYWRSRAKTDALQATMTFFLTLLFSVEVSHPEQFSATYESDFDRTLIHRFRLAL
jgi:hypothetical protein